MKPRIIVVTLASQILNSAINASLAFFLARHFGPLVFNDYLSIVSICSALAIGTKGIQATTALEYAIKKGSAGKQKIGDLQAVKFGFLSLLVWILISPLVSRILESSIWTVVAGGSIIFSAALGSRASGKLQGLSLFEQLQISTTFVSFLQIPFAGIALFLGAPLSVFIALLAIPSTLLFLTTSIILRNTSPTFIQRRNARIASSSTFAVLASLLFQLPILFLKVQFSARDIGYMTGLIFVYSNLITVSSVFGSFLLPAFVRNQSDNFKLSGIAKHLLFSVPVILFLGLSPLIGQGFLTVLFGDEYSSTGPALDAIFIGAPYLVWSVLSSLIQERLPSMRKPTLITFFLLLITESLIYSTVELNLVQYFQIHTFVGIIGVWAITSQKTTLGYVKESDGHE